MLMRIVLGTHITYSLLFECDFFVNNRFKACYSSLMNATLWQATSAAVSVLNLVLQEEKNVATVNCHCDFFSEKSPSGPISMVIFSLGFKTVLMFFYVSSQCAIS
jgi:hypothetical protein